MLAKKYKELFAKVKYNKDSNTFIGENIILELNCNDADTQRAMALTLKEFLKMTKSK